MQRPKGSGKKQFAAGRGTNRLSGHGPYERLHTTEKSLVVTVSFVTLCGYPESSLVGTSWTSVLVGQIK